MKTDRENLIELIKESNLSMWGKSGIASAAERRAYLADYLISKGVTIPVRCSECRYFDIDDWDGETLYGCELEGWSSM